MKDKIIKLFSDKDNNLSLFKISFSILFLFLLFAIFFLDAPEASLITDLLKSYITNGLL